MSFFDTQIIDAVTICRGLGFIGFAIYVLSFMLLSTGHISSETQSYFSLKLLAALCVIASLSVDFNLSSAMTQVFYVLISLFAMANRSSRKRSEQEA